MINLIENEVVGMALPQIRDKYGFDETEKLIDAIREVDNLYELDDEFYKMVEYGIKNTDYTNGQGKAAVRKAKTFKEAKGFFGNGVATPIKRARSFREIMKYNPYHAKDGKFSSANEAHFISLQTKDPWDKNESSYNTHLVTDKNGQTKISAKRQALYNQIINSQLEGIQKAAPGQQEVVFMGGGGGSGKSYLIKSQFIDVPPKEEKKAVHIDPDSIKDSLPEYKAMRQSDDEAVWKKAASYVQQESSLIAEQLYNVALARGYNVVYDGTASNITALKRQTDQARKAGVKTKAVYVATPYETAKESAEQRSKTSKRHVPEEILRTAHRNVSANFEQIATSSMFDNVQLVRNDRKNPLKTIAASTGGKLTIIDEGEYKKFLDKSNL